jgi:hypothetical protein
MNAGIKLLLRAVVTGFGLSLGSALYKRAAKQLGFDDEDKDKTKGKEEETKRTNQQDGGTDPGLAISPS